ncbi:unnamed protein product [Peniophora sp. CBMAI 1063]|nr:unnamed protein product [Peniophora sp. CBMAI 1063]
MGNKPSTNKRHITGTSEDLSDAQSRSPGSSTQDDVDAAEKAYAAYEQTWDVDQLKTAITLYQQAVNEAPEPDAYLLGELGRCLGLYHRARGNLDDLQRAIAAEQSALQLVPDGHPDRSLRLNNLSVSLRRRYGSLGATKDLASAIEMQLRSVELTPDDDPDLSTCLDNLGYLQNLRFQRFGALEDLESSISHRQRANELTSDVHPGKATRLNNLAQSLHRRFERLDDPADLERAITTQHRAVKLTPNGHPNLPIRLDNLGSLQWLRFKRFGELEDIESAISNQQSANELTADDHTDKAKRLHNLALSLCSRFERLDDPADLERAITMQRRAVKLTPNDHPGLANRLDNLGSLQWLRSRRFGEPEDIESAISNHQRANELTPDDHPSKATLLHNVAMSLVAYFRQDQTMEHFTEALAYYMAAASQTLDPPSSRLLTAKYVVNFLDENPEFSTPEMLLLAHSRIVDVLSEVVWLGHSMQRRLEESQKLGELVSSAVCVAVRVNAGNQAIEWLDMGRTLIWTQTLSLRSPLHDLEHAHPDLARALNDVHVRLQNTATTSSESIAFVLADASQAAQRSDMGLQAPSDRHRGLAIKQGKLLAEVRALPGFESFMRPKHLSALLPSSTSLDGHIVFINVDRTQCDALIILANRKTITIALPELSLAKAEALRSQWQAYLKQQNVRERGLLAPWQHRSRSTIPSHNILNRLWRWIVGPILKGLKLDVINADRARPPHIIWCPTGPLTQLPLHAAGIYDDDAGPRVYNFVVSSYTPSLSALTRSIDALAQQHTTPGILVVTQPNTPGLSSLPGTTLEGARLREVFAASQTPSTALNGEEATVGAVRLALQKHPWLHLACHGCQEVDDPLKSAFALHEGRLTLSDLMVTTADNAELAFLSACQTAVGDEKVPEESMHLAAGMLAVGYKGVVATMWSIKDDDAPLIVEAYYKELLALRASGALGAGQTGAAYALHEAARRLREKVGEKNVVRWAPFVHFGI